MALERIDSLFNIPEISQEFDLVRIGLTDSQKGLTDLFNTIKSFKGSTISTLADNTAKLNTAITGSIQATTKMAQNYDGLTQKIAQQTAFIKDNTTSLQAQATSYDQLIKQAVRNKLAMDDLTKASKDAKSAFDAGATTFSEYSQSLEEIRAAQQTLKTSNADITKSINNLEKQAQSADGSINGLQAKLNLLRQAYDKLGEAGQNTDVGHGLKQSINDTDAALQKLKNDTGRFQDNVGNYSGSFGKAFDVLKNQLSTLKSGPTGPAQTQQIALLESLLERLSQGFKTTRQEARAFQEAAVQLGLAIGQDSEEFLTFNDAVGHVQNGINDIKAATKFQAKDAKLISGLADAASTLAGAFGAAQAASALFAGDNEDLQKQMAKFQQLLVLINGLQAVANGLQAESGGMQLLLAARTSLLNAAKGVQLLITTKAVQVISAETVATVVNADAKEASVIATGEQVIAEEAATAATVENTAAVEANAAATTAAKGATGGLTTALVAGGLAVALIGAGAVLALLTAKLFGYKEAAGLTTDQQKALAKATEDLNESLNAQAKVLDDLDAGQKRYYTNLIQNAQDAGASQYAVLLAQQRFDLAQKDAAKAEIDRLGATDAAYSAQAQKVQQLLELQQAANEEIKRLNAIPKKGQSPLESFRTSQALSTNKDLLELYTAQLAPEQKALDNMTAARQKYGDAAQKVESDVTKFEKLSLDDQLAYTEKIETLRASLIKAKNDIIIGDERSTLKQRLAAIKSNAEQENAILQAQAATIRNNPANTINGFLTPEAQNKIRDIGEKERENLLKNAEERRKLAKQVADRQQQDAVDAYKAQQDAVIAASQQVEQGKVNNPNPFEVAKGPGLSDKLAALSAETEARRNKLNADLNQDLEKQQDAQEDNQAKIKAILQKYDNDILALQKEHQDKYLELEEEARQKSLHDWDRYYAQRKAQIDQDEQEQIVSLNGKKENDRKYSHDRQKIEDNAAIARASAAVHDAEIQRNATKAGTKERAEAEANLAKAAQGLSDSVHKKKKDNTDADKADLDAAFTDIKEQSDNYASAIVDVVDIGYNTQKVHLEELEARQQRSYEQQVKGINDSTASEEQKAIRLKILDDQRAVQQEQNARKQRQLDIQKAQFDKAKDVLGIITGTALAVVKALPNIPLAVSVGILGAAELAAAIATPLPHYKEGIGLPSTGEHPGGPAIVGDGGVSELILEPGKPARWSANYATRESLLPYTKVIPPHKINEMIMSGMFVNHQGALINLEPIDNRKELKELKEAVIWSAKETKAAIKSSRPRIINKITVSASWQTYVHNAVFK